jgi:transposase
MNHSRLISVDLAKSVFQVCVLNEKGEVDSNKQYTCKRLIETIAQYHPTVIVMEACYSANYFSRLFESYGHEVKLIPAQHVKPFVRGNKNDANDALAIIEAARKPDMSFVKVMTLEQQNIKACIDFEKE